MSLCPIKFSALGKEKAGVLGSRMEVGDCNCETINCAWWLTERPILKNDKLYNFKAGCVIKLIAEK